MVREYAYVFSAVSPVGGCHDSLVLPWADTEAISLFLKEVAGRHPDEYILVFMYQAAWHKAKALKVPPNMTLAFLPPYSPELNPQEQVWDELREKSLANRLFIPICVQICRIAALLLRNGAANR
ncbi:MAG: transposase [Holophagales bacterium]|jgi:transposase|nr:transposase [Holophagales bacterium]